MLAEIFDIALTLIGLMNMLAASHIAITIYRKKTVLKTEWKLFLGLISIFIIGGLFFIVKFIFTSATLDSIIQSLLFFFGGLFVLLTMKMFKISIEKIELAHHFMHTIEEMKRVAEHDDLTNLYNRRFFKKYLKEILSLCKVTDKQFALFFIDINNFKYFNDNYGHLVGDQVLISTANYLKSFFRTDDVIARISGDEFAIITELKKDLDIEKYAKNLLERINTMHVVFNDNTLKINLSVGISIISKETESVDAIMESADAACYEAKKRKQFGSQYSLS